MPQLSSTSLFLTCKIRKKEFDPLELIYFTSMKYCICLDLFLIQRFPTMMGVISHPC